MWGSIPACMLSMSCIDGLRKQLLLLQQFFLSFFSNAGEFNHMFIEVSWFVPMTPKHHQS